jgi:hypothetical protein
MPAIGDPRAEGGGCLRPPSLRNKCYFRSIWKNSRFGPLFLLVMATDFGAQCADGIGCYFVGYNYFDADISGSVHRIMRARRVAANIAKLGGEGRSH